MKKIVFAAVAALLPSFAISADLPVRGPAVAPAPVFVAMNWSGFYVGAQLGYATKSYEPTIDPTYVAMGLTEETDHKPKGGLAGVVVGYNFQNGNFVYGIDLAAALANIRGASVNDLVHPVVGVITQSQRSKVLDFYNARVRVGYAVGSALFYVAGGIAAARTTTNFTASALLGSISSRDNEFHIGYMLGAGIDYRLTNNWSTRVEYSYFDLGERSHVGVNHKSAGHLFRIGLNYHFGSPSAPVVAKY